MMVFKRGNITVALAVAATILLGIGAIAAGVAAASGGASEDRIAPGVQIAGIAVGERSRAEAVEQLRPWAREAMQKPVTLTAPRSGRKWNKTLAEAGGRFDLEAAVADAYQIGREENWFVRVASRSRAARGLIQIEPAFHLDEDRLKKLLAAIGEDIHVAPRDAKAKMVGKTLVVSATERKGLRLDVEATAAALLKGGEASLRNGGGATLVVAEEKPAVTAADLGKVSHLLGSFTTYYGSSSSNRRHNVELAAANMDGTLLAPGAVFSYNQVVGPRTRRLGWRTAHEYRDGQVVDGIGGGVCQPSSTLYNAVLLANLKIVRRSNHSMPVKYVPAGRDATVSYGSLDLQFENDTDGPIYVAAKGRNGRLTMAIYGQEPAEKKEVEIVSGGRRPRASGGFLVTTWRVVTNEDGTTTREALSTDRYRPLVTASVKPRRPRPPIARRAAPKPSAPSAAALAPI